MENFTAHPKIDPKSGELIFFGYQFGSNPKSPFINYAVVNKNGEVTKKTKIDIKYDGMMHDFAVSENYSIILDLPFVLGIENVLTGKPIIHFGKYKPSRFGIFKRHEESTIQWFELPGFYIFHVANAWEEGNNLILHAVKHNEVDSEFFGYSDTNHNIFNDAHLTEWKFDLKSGKVTEKILIKEFPCEFPTINPNYVGQKNQFVYLAEKVESKFSGLLKYDTESGKITKFDYGKNVFGGEGVFIPKNGSKSEDDGYLVTFAFSENDSKSFLYVVDGISMNLTCKLEMPRRVPFGFHGIWVNK